MLSKGEAAGRPPRFFYLKDDKQFIDAMDLESLQQRAMLVLCSHPPVDIFQLSRLEEQVGQCRCGENGKIPL